jgi:hypothetical protein
MASSVVQAGSPLDDYFNGESDYAIAFSRYHEHPGDWEELDADVVDEVKASTMTDSNTAPFGAEEAGDTVSTSLIFYVQC